MLWTLLGKQGFFDLREGGLAVIYPASVCSIIFAAGSDGIQRSIYHIDTAQMSKHLEDVLAV